MNATQMNLLSDVVLLNRVIISEQWAASYQTINENPCIRWDPHTH